MYKYIPHQLNDSQIKYHFAVVDDEEQNCKGFDEISYAEFIHLLKSENKDFLKAFCETLNNATDKLSAYFWECIPVSQKLINKKFEFVVTKSEELNNITLDSGPFAKHLADIAIAGTCAGNFPNKKKDAILIIPGAKKDIDYKNISQFTINAPQEQQQKLWQEVANRLSKELEKNEAPKWLSTHGLGVHYLHVRIDNHPKYYHFEQYKAEKNQQENSDNNNSGELKKMTSQNLSDNQENTEKTNSQKDKLLLMGGIGAILLIGISSVIWWKRKKDKTNQK